MSETFDRVRGIRELPLFPLPVVLFPDVPMSLHIFESRYRQMLSDIRVGDRLFGLSYFDEQEHEPGELPPLDHVGCVAEVSEIQALPDGRSNIVVLGLIRYRIEAYVDKGEPYLVGRPSFFEDEAEDEDALKARTQEVVTLFMRIARSVRIINNDRSALVELPEDEPETLSFLVAAAVEMEMKERLEMLEIRSTLERLRRLRDLLARLVGGYEERARMHEITKGNGHSGKKLDIS
ncbi:MAG: LON peptidase substrate-binding domain-containing protein [Pyrinomonadaceae bacterium]